MAYIRDTGTISLTSVVLSAIDCSLLLVDRLLLPVGCILDWKNHAGEYYQCSKYKENPDIASKGDKTEARAALVKYLHYFTRVSIITLPTLYRFHDIEYNKCGVWL